MTQKKRPDLNKILRSILLILGIVLMLLKISAHASAEGLSSQEFLDDYISSTGIKDSQYEQYFDDAMEDCQYWLCGYLGNTDVYIIYFSSVPFTEDHFVINYGYTGLPYGFFSSKTGSSLVDSVDFYSFFYQYSNNNLSVTYIYHDYFASGSSPSSLGSPFYYRFSPTTHTVLAGSTSSSSSAVTYTNCNFDCYVNTGYNSFDIFELTNPVLPEVDSRFTAYTSLDQSGKKLLNITWDSQVYPSTGNFVYESSTIALQVAINGQSSTVSFSSTDYPELFISGNSSYIPYKFIQKLANIAIVQDTDTFYLEKITLTQQAYPSAAGSSASQSFTASTVYSLNLGEDVVEIPSIQQVQSVSVNYTQIVSGSDFAVSSGTSVTPPSWANILSIAICDYTSAGGSTTINDPSLYDYIFMKDNGAMTLYSSTSSDFNLNIFVNGLTASSTEVSVPYQQGLNLFYKDFLPQLFDSYDVVLISMNSINGNTATVTDSYYYTASYYSKLSIRSLGNIQSGVEAAAYYGKALYDYSYQRFNGIAESLESLRLSSNNLLSSVNANILNLQDLVSGGTDCIVNAISGLSGGSGGGISVSDLSDTLNTLFMPSFEWDTINYQDYLDSIGVLALPFEFVFDTQSIIKSNYSASLVMPINDFSVPLGKDQNDNDLEFTVFEDHEDFTFLPTSIFPAAIWSVFQYLAAFGLVIGEAWFTYVHIFRKEEKSGDF